VSRRLALAARPGTDAGGDALRALAVALVPILQELLQVERTGAELVEVAAVVPLPRRAVCRACREGRVEGARRVGRRWLAARSAVDEWVRSCGPRVVPPADDRADDEVEAMLASLVRPSRPRRRRAG
jgi:hypothetical protein